MAIFLTREEYAHKCESVKLGNTLARSVKLSRNTLPVSVVRIGSRDAHIMYLRLIDTYDYNIDVLNGRYDDRGHLIEEEIGILNDNVVVFMTSVEPICGDLNIWLTNQRNKYINNNIRICSTLLQYVKVRDWGTFYDACCKLRDKALHQSQYVSDNRSL